MADLAIKTVLEMDLVSYSDVARTLEEHLDVHAVKALQDQIQGFVDQGLSEVGLRRGEIVIATAGDNAILVFDDPEPMHRLSAAVTRATSNHNQARSLSSAQRWFRMGCATGDVLVDKSSKEVVGTAIARAVRLESASEKGSLLVDIPTFDALPANLQSQYAPEITVTGKREEHFVARRCTFVKVPDPAAESSSSSASTPLLNEVWNLLDANLQDAFALAYNKKRRERSERPTRISTRDLFQALTRINDASLQSLLEALPSSALPEPSDLFVTNERRLLAENHFLSDCVEESLGAFARVAEPERKVRPADIFVDISKHGHGPSVELLRKHGIGPAEIEARVTSLGVKVFEPRDV